MFSVVCFHAHFIGDRSVFVYLGGLFNTFILRKKFKIFLKLVTIDLEKASSSVIVCDP